MLIRDLVSEISPKFNNNNNNNFALPLRDHVFQNFLEFGIEGHFRRENLTSFLVG